MRAEDRVAGGWKSSEVLARIDTRISNLDWQGIGMLPRRLAEFNRLVTNRTYGRLAGNAPWMGLVIHRGRKSNREYRTPVNVYPCEGGYRISLDYGPESDWVRNVTAQRGCSLVTRGGTVDLVEPQVIHNREATWAPPVVRHVLAKVGSGYYLQLHRVD